MLLCHKSLLRLLSRDDIIIQSSFQINIGMNLIKPFIMRNLLGAKLCVQTVSYVFRLFCFAFRLFLWGKDRAGQDAVFYIACA